MSVEIGKGKNRLEHTLNWLLLTELSCKNGICQERGPKGLDF